MALFGVAPAAMRPTALLLNALVAMIGTLRFARAGYTPWRLIAPLSAGAVPAAFIGGRIVLPPRVYEPLLAVLLVAAALRLWNPRVAPAARVSTPHPATTPLPPHPDQRRHPPRHAVVPPVRVELVAIPHGAPVGRVDLIFAQPGAQ